MSSNNDGFFKVLKHQGFKEDIDYDQRTLKGALDKYKKIDSEEDKKFEKKRSDTLKRTLLLIGRGDPKITSTQGEEKKEIKASENNVPVPFYLTHGSRNLITIPRLTNNTDNPDQLMNWLVNGDAKNKAINYNVYSQKDAKEKGNLLYVRSAATHGVQFNNEGKVEKETKGFLIGASDFLKNCWKSFVNSLGYIIGKTPYPVTSHHFGIDYSLEHNSPIDSKEHGHLYVYYQAPTQDREGAILIGMEGAAPDSPKHSKTGASAPISPTNSLKYRDLKEKDTEGIIVPDTVNSMRIDLDSSIISNLTSIDNTALDRIDNGSIVKQTPGENFVETLTNINISGHNLSKPEQQKQTHVGMLLEKSKSPKPLGFGL